MQYISYYDSPVGMLTMSSDGEFLTGLWMNGQKYDRATLKKEELVEISESADVCLGDSEGDVSYNGAKAIFEQARGWLDVYFTGKDPGFLPPLKVAGSEFRQMVSMIMREIPFGETTTYGAIAKEVARRMGKKSMSAQAVGGAVGHNPIGIIIPCHRVLGSNGSLTGYAGGLEKKVFLLKNEGIL